MKEKILLLKQQGQSYKAISKQLGISESTVWRNLRPEVNQKHRMQWKQAINNRKAQAKAQLGNKCSICGYSKSLRALDLHHRNELTKLDKLKQVKDWRKLTKAEFQAELAKCVLVCKNCHCEIHDNIRKA